jgi:hypothetical protein
MSINRLYHTWFQRIEQLWPSLRVTQRRNFAWLVVGLYLSKSVFLSEIAGKMPSKAKLPSLTRRLGRFLDNRAIRVRKLYAPLAEQVLQSHAKVGEIRLILDCTKVGFGYQLMMVALAHRKRALPIAWTWVRRPKGHSRARVQLALLAYVRQRVPEGVPVLLVGDCEFGAVDVMRQLDRWKWQYVLRQPSSHLLDLTLHNHWQSFGSIVEKPGQSVWLGRGFLTKEHVYAVNLLAHWEPGYDRPWLLATNLPDRQTALRAYRRRMWIEEMFGDMKGHGFDLESTHLRHFLRLSRLTLAVALLYVWLVVSGARAIKNGQRQLVDRKDRRDLSVFQIGWRIVQRRLVNDCAFSIRLQPIVHHKLSGG